jgi:hypothetical protein
MQHIETSFFIRISFVGGHDVGTGPGVENLPPQKFQGFLPVGRYASKRARPYFFAGASGTS